MGLLGDVWRGTSRFVRRAFSNLPQSLAFGFWPHATEERLVDPYKQSSSVYACVSLLAKNFANPPLTVRTGPRKNSKLVEDHPMALLFQRPNLFMDWTHFAETCKTFRGLRGAVFLVSPGRRVSEYPTEVWPMDPDLFKPIKGLKGWPTGWRYHPMGEMGEGTRDFTTEEVLIVRDIDPDNPWGWMSPIQAAMLGVKLDHKAALWANSFFEHSCEPGGIIYSDHELNEDEYKAAKRRWLDRFGGSDKAFMPAFLYGGMKYERIPINNRDAEFLEQRRFSREQIAEVFGVPQEVMGWGKKTFDNVDAAWKNLWVSNLKPEIERFESALFRHYFLPVDGGQFWPQMDTSNVSYLQPDLDAKLDQGLKFRELGYTPNQINERLDLGMKRLEWGDEPAPGFLKLPEPEPGDEEGESTEDGGDGQVVEEGDGDKKLPDKDAEDEAEAAASKAIQVIRDFALESETKAAVGALTSAVRPLEKAMAARLRRHFMALRRETLARLFEVEVKTKATKAGPALHAEEVLFDLELANGRLRKLVGPTYREAIRRGARSVLVELGLNPDDWKPGADFAKIQNRHEIQIVGVNESLRKKLRAALEQGVQDQASLADLASMMREQFNFTGAKANAVARTEVNNSVNEARDAQMDAEDVDRIQWVNSGKPYSETHVRPSHQISETIRRGDTFSNGLRYPGDPEGPPEEVINCRCRVIARRSKRNREE